MAKKNILKEALEQPFEISAFDRHGRFHQENFNSDNLSSIPNAGLLILPHISHFAFINDPEQFNNEVLHFLGRSSAVNSQ